MTPGPPPQPHGWLRLGFGVSRFPDFCEGGAWHVLSYLGVRSLGLFSPTFFSTSSKKKKTDLDLHLSRERAALAPFPRISGVGHSGSWPPLHCGDSTKPELEVVPGASLHSEALSPECGREHQETGDG